MKKDKRESSNMLLRIKEENLDPTIVEEKKNEYANEVELTMEKKERCRATSADQISKCFGWDQCFKNRIKPAGPTGQTVDRPQNRSGSMQKLFLIEPTVKLFLIEPTIKPMNRRSNRPVPIIIFFQGKTMLF